MRKLLGLLAVLALSVGLAAVSAAPALSAGGSCLGQPTTSYTQTVALGVVTITGTSGRDVIAPSPGNENLIHVIRGKAGNDLICGGNGPDDINGGKGNDQIYGKGGNDIVRGQSGNDTVLGESGADDVYGGSGVDIVLGGSGNGDFVKGGPGGDYYSGGSGSGDLCVVSTIDTNLGGCEAEILAN